MMFWFLSLAVLGVMNMTGHLEVLRACNPMRAIQVLLSDYNKAGFMILGSVFLATTGAEALYSDMGHVGKINIYELAFCEDLSHFKLFRSRSLVIIKSRECASFKYTGYESILFDGS